MIERSSEPNHKIEPEVDANSSDSRESKQKKHKHVNNSSYDGDVHGIVKDDPLDYIDWDGVFEEISFGTPISLPRPSRKRRQFHQSMS